MGVTASGIRIEVDSDVLQRSGQRMASIGTQLGLLSDALGGALGSGIAAGWDAAGANFGFKYGHQAQDFADALADAANSYTSVGLMLEATGHNYENADAASTIGGSAPAGGVRDAPGRTTAGHAPAGSSSAVVPPPMTWSLIESLLTMVPGVGSFAGAGLTWPSGNPSLMHITATQWKNVATGLAALDDDMATVKGALAQQHIPEEGQIQAALDDLGGQLAKMSEFASTFSTSINDFAAGVQDAQDAIRRLLDRISLDGLWDTVTGFLTGDGDDILREVARDVGEVLENFENQVKGVVGLLGELTTLIGDAATAFQKWIRPILVHTFGDDVGNALADTVTLYTDFEVGLVTGVISTVSGWVSMADPDTWKGMADVALSVAEDPSTLPGVLQNMGKQFVAWDQWSGDHPGRAAGEAAFNIGSLFFPGGPLSKTGNLAKTLRYGNELFEERRLPRVSDLPGVGGGDRTTSSLDNSSGAAPGHQTLQEFRPQSVPDSLVNPVPAPHGVDVPTTPPGRHGPPDPPDPPNGRSVGPPESEPGHSDSHTSESSSPAGTHQAGPAVAQHAATTLEVDGTTHVVERHATAPSDSHRQVSEDHPGREPAPAPTGEQSGGNERPTTHDGPQSAQQHANGDDGGRRQDPAVTTPEVVAGGGMSIAPHTAGGLHNSADGTPSRRTATEAPARTPDARVSENPRSQATASAAAGAGVAPTQPVTPAASSSSGNPIVAQSISASDSPSPRSGEGPPVAVVPDRQGDQSGAGSNSSGSRSYGPHQLRPVENTAYQTAVEDALRDPQGEYLVHADPRTNDYGNLINDGGHTVPGRSNNCLDTALSALSSFRGEPTVSAPRYPDPLPNGLIDSTSGERGGLQRASDWLGDPVLLVAPSLPIADRFAELHQRIADMGPGSSALVVNEWHARNPVTGQPMYQPDGHPVIAGSHATVVVYPESATGPVWWDPQMRTASDHPPAPMVDRSASLWATTVPSTEGGHGHATGDTGASPGVSGSGSTGRDVQPVSIR